MAGTSALLSRKDSISMQKAVDASPHKLSSGTGENPECPIQKGIKPLHQSMEHHPAKGHKGKM